MKKVFVFLIILFFSSSVARDSYTQINGNQTNDIDHELSVIQKRFDQRFFRALFSIDEIRPYLFLNINKLSDVYQNKWIPPGKLLELLSDTEKDSVLIQSAKVIRRESRDGRIKAINRINSWCLLDKHMDFLIENYKFERKFLVHAMNNIFVTKKVLGSPEDKKDIDITAVTDTQVNKAYCNGINIISNLSQPHQLKYLAQLYNEMSEIMSN